jgi:hypothetical protein
MEDVYKQTVYYYAYYNNEDLFWTSSLEGTLLWESAFLEMYVTCVHEVRLSI